MFCGVGFHSGERSPIENIQKGQDPVISYYSLIMLVGSGIFEILFLSEIICNYVLRSRFFVYFFLLPKREECTES